MGTIIETINVTVTGANPHTYVFQVPVDIVTGAGSPLSIPLVGTIAGTDTVTASMPSHAYVSNNAEIAWQGINGDIAVGPVTIRCYDQVTTNDKGYVVPPTWPNSPQLTTTSNSLVFNQVFPNNPINGYTALTNIGIGGGYKVIPMVAVQQTQSGQFASSLAISNQTTFTGGNTPGFILDCRGSLYVSKAGTYTFYMTYANVGSYGVYIGGGAVNAGHNGNNAGTFPFPALGPQSGLPLFDAQSVQGPAHPNSNYLFITFPAEGTYPFEVIYNQFFAIQFQYDNNGFFQITYLPGFGTTTPGQGFSSAKQWLPVSTVATPPNGTAGTGPLRLSPTGGVAGLKLQGQTDTLTLTIQNVVYSTVPYIPILEGTTGSLILSGATFPPTGVTPPIAGPIVVPDNAATAGAVFALSGDNSAFSGLVTVAPGTVPNFSLAYNGGPIIAHVDETNLVITAKDLAWYHAADTSYDTFPVGSGGLQFAVVIDWLANPTPFVSGVSPLSHAADGSQVQFTVSLTKPISPQQQGAALGTGNSINLTTSWSGGVVTNTIVPIIAGGWLTGWFVNATLPVSSSTVVATLNVTIQGTLTRLTGTTITTGNFVYVNNVQVASVTLTGVALTPPVEFAFSVAPPGPDYIGAQAITITATVYNKNNVSNTVTFLRRQNGTLTQATQGTSSVPTTSTTGVVGGQTVFIKTYQLATTTAAFYPSTNLGFSCIDQNSLSMSPVFWSPTVYTHETVGGGGGGCPEVGMYVGSGKQVHDVTPGYLLDTLQGDTPDYISGLPLCEPAEVMQLDYSTEECFRLSAENGAEVIISGSTPVATREAIEALAQGQDAAEVAVYASQIRAGAHVITNVGGGPEWSLLVETQAVGVKRVARLYCGGRNFAAGVKPGKYIYTHNLQPVVK